MIRGCESCQGDGEIAVEAEPAFGARAATASRIRGLFEAARRTAVLARRYLAEGGPRDRRYRACLVQVRAYRMSIRHQRRLLVGRRGELAWCIACRGTGLTSIECEGCGHPVSADTIDDDALDYAKVVVHKGCDTGHRYFEVAS